MKRIAVVAVALLALALPAQAIAATAEYRGKTKQGLKASARVVDGRLKLLKIAWKAPCDHHGPWRARTKWEDRPEGPIEHNGAKFSDGGTEDVQLKDGRIVYNLKLSGEISEKLLTGKMTVRMKLYSTDGEHVNNCRVTVFFSLPRD